jgi:hypothetical protein
VLLATSLYLLALYGFWPLVTHQDLLPAIPLVAIGIAAVVFRGSDTAPAHRGLAAFVATICIVHLATAAVPFHNELADEANELARVLRLTRPGDYVMDAKGEMIFRRRPVYWAMEGITVARMHDGSIADDIPERLAATGTPIVIMDRLPARDVAFVTRNYMPIGPAGGLIRVAGQLLGVARAGERVTFDVAVPAEYAIVTPDDSAHGTLDGTPYDGARRLAAGPHTFVASADSRLALVWAPALKRGLGERELFAATER